MIYRTDYEKGKTIKIRNKAQSELRSIIETIVAHIYDNEEIYQLLESGNTGGIKLLDQQFGTLSYFESDMSDVLRKVREKIDSFSDVG